MRTTDSWKGSKGKPEIPSPFGAGAQVHHRGSLGPLTWVALPREITTVAMRFDALALPGFARRLSARAKE
jgi:hypothetical protein